MNKIYKIVWNKARECYMVVCEYAKSQTKGCSTARLFANRRAAKIATAILAVGAIGMNLGVQSAYAEDNHENENITKIGLVTGKGSTVSTGIQNVSLTGHNIAILETALIDETKLNVAGDYAVVQSSYLKGSPVKDGAASKIEIGSSAKSVNINSIYDSGYSWFSINGKGNVLQAINSSSGGRFVIKNDGSSISSVSSTGASFFNGGYGSSIMNAYMNQGTVVIGTFKEADPSVDDMKSNDAWNKTPKGAFINGVGSLYSTSGNRAKIAVEADYASISSTYAGSGTVVASGDNASINSARINSQWGLISANGKASTISGVGLENPYTAWSGKIRALTPYSTIQGVSVYDGGSVIIGDENKGVNSQPGSNQTIIGVSVYKNNSTNQPKGATAYGDNSTIIGSRAGKKGVSSYQATGTNAAQQLEAHGDFSTIIGSESVDLAVGVYGNHSTVIGSFDSQAGSKSTTNQGTTYSGNYTTVIGSELSKATGLHSMVLSGSNSSASGQYSLAFGGNSKASNLNSIALGSSSSAGVDEAVALGSYSSSNRSLYSSDATGGYISYNDTNKTFEWTKSTETTNPTWKATAAAVSVGGGTNSSKQTVTRQIINVAAGYADTDAVNVAQLKAVKDYLGNMVTEVKNIVEASSASGSSEGNASGSVKGAPTVTPSSSMTNTIDYTTNKYNASNEVKYDIAEDTNPNDNVVSSLTITATSTKTDENGTTTTGPAAVTFQDTDTTYDFALDSAENGAINITSNTNDKWQILAGNGITIDGDNTTKQFTINVGGSGADFLEAEDVGMGFKGDVGDKINVGNNGTLNIVGGQKDASKLSDAPNIGVVNEGGDLKIKLAKDLDLGDGSLTLNKGGKTVKIEGNNVDMGGNQIHNVEAGTAPTDAVNVSQLKGLEGRVDNRINKVGARAAALAALHPLDFDPDDKLNFAAGYGHYKGENAGAIGAFYRPDEKVMFSIAGTVAEHDTMINAGISFSLDRTSRQTNSKTAMARDILEMKEQIAALAANNKALTAQNNQFLKVLGNATGIDGKPIEMSKVIMFPDVPENHWAYEYVEGLMKRGIIEGYPDGNYSGDRSCTRYEFAAMLYRALKAGQVVPAELTLEFASEIGRFRVDRVHGADDSNHKIERIRVNGDHDYGRDHYGSKNPQPVTSRGPQYPEAARVAK